MYWEPNPRHVEFALNDLQLDSGRSSPLGAPGSKEEPKHTIEKEQAKDESMDMESVDAC